MIDSKVIDNNVKNLLIDVRNQSERYKSLFTKLEELSDSIDEEIKVLRDLSQSYGEKFDNEIVDLEIKYQNSIKSIEGKIDKVNQLEFNFNKLNELKEQFELLLEENNNKTNEIEVSFSKFIDDLNNKFLVEIKSIKNYTEKEIELELRSLESRIYDRIRKVDRHLEHYDKQIFDANKLQEDTNKTIFKQMRSLEGFMDNIKSITESMSRTFNSDLRNTESHLLEKIDIIEERQEKLKKIEFIDDIIDIDNAISKQRRDIALENEKIKTTLLNYEKQISLLRVENKKLESEINSNKSISTIAIVISIISLILLIVMTFLV